MEIPIEQLLPWLDIAGLSVFAASGALLAAHKRLDVGGGDKVGQWSDGVVPLRGGVKTGHWLG